MKQTEWIVFRKGKIIEHVFFDADCDKDYVYDSLVNHDGYSPDIEIMKRR